MTAKKSALAARRDNPPTAAACPRCGIAFTCGMKAGQALCWCAELPPILPPEPLLGRCFCPDCLRLLAHSETLAPRSAP